MKVTVNRQLNGGVYQVAFKVADFTAEEVKKMGSFGVPTINILFGQPPGARQGVKVGINQLNENLRAGFLSEQEARGYEKKVLDEIRDAMTFLRTRNDDFSASDEVSI